MAEEQVTTEKKTVTETILSNITHLTKYKNDITRLLAWIALLFTIIMLSGCGMMGGVTSTFTDGDRKITITSKYTGYVKEKK